MMLSRVVVSLANLLSLASCQLGDSGGHTSRLIGGVQITDKSSHPWMALMEGKIKTGLFSSSSTFCGATLIASKWAIGAAHCYTDDLADASKWTASVGTLKPYTWVQKYLINPVGWLFHKPEWRAWQLDVDKIIKHPGFVNQPMFDNDIAVLKFKQEVPFSQLSYVRQLALPTANNITLPQNGSLCTITGWGCTSDGASITNQEMQVSLPILARDTCRMYWPNMTANQFCAGNPNGGKSVCSGDSGGPVECTNGTQPFLAGIVSFADRDHPERYPSGFLYVANYVDWIQQVMASN